MKKALLFLALFVTIGCHGQSYLTNGQVYNFDIGDTMQMTVSRPWTNYIISYVTDAVVSKQVNTGTTTITYGINSTTFTPPSTYSTISYAKVVTNLDSLATPFNISDMCAEKHDTVYKNACNFTVWQRDGFYGGCESEQKTPTLENCYVVEGLGGPYFYYTSIGDVPPVGQDYSYTLTYYSKASGRCGSIVTSVQDISKDPALTIYPNPNNGQFTLTHRDFDKLSIHIFDLNGKKVLEQSLDNKTSVDARQLKEGVYNLVIIGPGYSFYKKLVIVH